MSMCFTVVLSFSLVSWLRYKRLFLVVFHNQKKNKTHLNELQVLCRQHPVVVRGIAEATLAHRRPRQATQQVERLVLATGLFERLQQKNSEPLKDYWRYNSFLLNKHSVQ